MTDETTKTIIYDVDGRHARVHQGQLQTADRWTGWLFALILLDHAVIGFLLFVGITTR